MADDNTSYKIISDNRQVRFQYEILEILDAGVELKGTEVKSIRAGKVNLKDGFVIIRGGEALLLNVHISPHTTTIQNFNHEPRRTRKLLLHKMQIRKLTGKVQQEGLTLVPLKMYMKGGWVKIDIALVRGKKLHDKREDDRKKQDKRDMERAMKTR
jgi:SsrA-binding protein